MELLVQLPLEDGVIAVLGQQRLAVLVARLAESKARGQHGGDAVLASKC